MLQRGQICRRVELNAYSVRSICGSHGLLPRGTQSPKKANSFPHRGLPWWDVSHLGPAPVPMCAQLQPHSLIRYIKQRKLPWKSPLLWFLPCPCCYASTLEFGQGLPTVRFPMEETSNWAVDIIPTCKTKLPKEKQKPETISIFLVWRIPQ